MVSGHLILIWTLPWEMKDWEWAHQASFGEEEEYQCNFIMLRNYLYTISQTPKQHVVISKCFFQPFPHPPKMIYSHHFLDTCRYKYSNATKNRCAPCNLSSWVNYKSICFEQRHLLNSVELKQQEKWGHRPLSRLETCSLTILPGGGPKVLVATKYSDDTSTKSRNLHWVI